MDTEQPASARIPGVSKVLLRSSNLVAWPKDGPTATGKPSLASSPAIRCPSVQCSSVSFTPNSLAMRMAVKMSLA